MSKALLVSMREIVGAVGEVNGVTGDEGAEGDDEDGQRHGPGDHLRLQHRLEVGLVEV